ncbi:MAG: hypothetical protein H7Y19_00935 [Luteimonas sp.]|nr:hypothetical protein [Luteimonas sp.]
MNAFRSLLASTLVTSGCASVEAAPENRQLDGAAAAKSVVLCETTLSDLESRLGAPTRDGLLHASRVVSWITAWDPLVRYLAVQVNQEGVVTDLYWDVPSEIPWTPTDQCHKR